MTSYDNISFDLPNRCSEILDAFEDLARFRGREVTFILSNASTGFLVPYERLREPQEVSSPHPSRARERHRKEIRRFDKLLDEEFLSSVLWNVPPPHTWRADKLFSVEEKPARWPELINPKHLGPKKLVKSVLGTLRNALAHGNIFTRGEPKIDRIIFLAQVAQNTYKFNYVMVSPSDFLVFLRNWYMFLAGVSLPVFVVPEEAEVAA